MRRSAWLAGLLGLAWLVRSGWAWLLVVVAVVAVTGLGVWFVRWRESFDRQIVQRVRGAWRGVWVYRRGRWDVATGSVGLDGPSWRSGRQEPDRVYPRRSAVRSCGPVDRFRVRMLPGQTVARWVEAAPALCQALGVMDLRFRPVERARWWRRSRLVLHVTAVRRDTLAEPVAVPPHDPEPDLHGLPVAVCEDGQTWRLDLLGQHVLIGGATGAGKASALWSIIDRLAPDVRSGRVQLWGIDPKALELSYGGRLFAQVVDDGDPEAAADLLEDLVRAMDRRKGVMRGAARVHTPTPGDPLIVLVIDELAALTAWAPQTVRKRIETALALLLTQGRALAVSVVAAAQDPRKESLGLRGLFTVRVGMRLSESGEVDLLLGSGARAQGAACDRIARGTPGVAWVFSDGDPTPRRIRFGWVADTDIRTVASTYTYTPPALHEGPEVGEAA